MANEDSSEIDKRLKEAIDRVEKLRRISSESKCAYRINEFCAAYGLSRTTTYALIATGKLRSVVVAVDA